MTMRSETADQTKSSSRDDYRGPPPPPHKTLTSNSVRRVWAGRVIFLLGLAAVAAVLGYCAHLFLTRSETELADTQFESVANRALSESRGILGRKRRGTITMASMAATANPNVTLWPFVTIEGYEAITTNLIATSQGREMGLCPLVTPDQLADFEDFAYDFFERARLPEPFPNGTAVSSFGKGVYGVDPALNTSDHRYKETDGSTYYNSSNKIFAPILQHNAGNHPALMLNLHFQQARGQVIDGIIECSQNQNGTNATECGFVTDMIFLTNQDDEPGPSALLMQPIYPGHAQDVLAGVLASSIVWGEVLENVFGEEASGIDCVLETNTQVYTWTVTRGIAYYSGEGDLHDTSYDEYRRDIVLTGVGLFSDKSAAYTLSLYPNQALFEVYSTDNPRIATIGAILAIVFATFLFIMYDFFVRQEFHAKSDLLKSKRKFVRFVSHEVRTPLNSVCMGLALMQEEIGSVLGLQCLDENLDMDKVLASVKDREDVKCHRVAEWLQLIGDVLGNARSSVDVLNDLLNYDKVEMGSLKLEYSSIPILHVIERTAQEFNLPAMKKEIQFVTECPCCEPLSGESEKEPVGDSLAHCKVVGDSVRITQVLRNLMSNALKFTPEKGEIVVRTIWLKPNEKTKEQTKDFTFASGATVTMVHNGKLQVTVRDSGAGLTKEQLKGVFDDGVQFNATNLQAGGGSGLGLYIAKGIVVEHGGTLTVYSEGLNHGCSFTITLPLYRHRDDGLTSATADVDVEKSPRRGSIAPVEKLSVLVVDDSDMNRKLLRRLLENRSHVCEEACDGQVAVDLVAKVFKQGNPYDLILMDYEMPVLDGPAATQLIRELGCDSFIVGITGNLLPEDIAHFRSCGANDVLPKPINMAALDEMWMEYHLTRREPKRTFREASPFTEP